MSHSPVPEYYNQASERLTFRAFEQEDVLRWEPFFHDNPSLDYLGAKMLEHLSPVEKAANWIDRQTDRQASKQFGQLAVLDKETGEFMGVGGVIFRDLEDGGEYEITYSLLQEHWGKGLGTELAVHFRDYLKNVVGLGSVISIIHVENEASINVAKKNGMVLESEFEFMEMPVAVYRATF
jgi:ribosomal-protein-alanine N-acetyltransferase